MQCTMASTSTALETEFETKSLDHGCWDVADIAKLQKHLYKLQTYQAFGHTKN
jgi:hypothetical protein